MSRPPVEDIMRLTANPDSPWGMADTDAQNICRWVLVVESELALRTVEVTALKAINEEMRGRLEKAERVVREIAEQKTLEELSEAGEDCEGDFEGAYDTMIELARAVYSKET